MYIDEDGILRIEIVEVADITLENIKKNFDREIIQLNFRLPLKIPAKQITTANITLYVETNQYQR